MKYRILVFILYTGVLGGIWTACDKIDEPLSLVSDHTISDDDRLLDTVFVVDSIHIDKKQVLIEEFTGHKCVNCAGASIMAHEWSEENDHRIVIYGIHAGYYAEPDATGLYTADFRSVLGDELFNDFSQPFNPTAAINRVEYEGDVIHNANKWQSIVEQELVKSNVIEMSAKNIYYSNLDTVEIRISTTFLQQLAGNYKLAIYIAEDGIIAPQKNNEEEFGPTPDWVDYTHRNVLRESVNGKSGTNVSFAGTIVQGEEYVNKFYYPLNQDWDPEITSLNVVAFVYHVESQEILQVSELGIKVKE